MPANTVARLTKSVFWKVFRRRGTRERGARFERSAAFARRLAVRFVAQRGRADERPARISAIKTRRENTALHTGSMEMKPLTQLVRYRRPERTGLARPDIFQLGSAERLPADRCAPVLSVSSRL